MNDFIGEPLYDRHSRDRNRLIGDKCHTSKQEYDEFADAEKCRGFISMALQKKAEYYFEFIELFHLNSIKLFQTFWIQLCVNHGP